MARGPSPAAGPPAALGPDVPGFRIENELGRGGMSVVYRAEQLELGRDVALKILAPELATENGFRERFLREARLAGRLQHPNIVDIFDVGEAGEALYIAMELIDGEDLGRLVAREGRLEPERTVVLLEPIASALDAAHSAGLVHRDVKPGNILISATGYPYLADFGVARDPLAPGLTTAGSFVGTPEYSAPEQLAGDDELDRRVDVYALGCVLYECLTGRRPPAKGPVPAPSSVRPGLATVWDEIVARATATSRDDRYPSCGAFIAAARECLGSFSKTRIEAPRPRRVEVASGRAAEPTTASRQAGAAALLPWLRALDRRTRMAAGVVAAGALATVILLVGYWPDGAEGERVDGRAKPVVPFPDARERTLLGIAPNKLEPCKRAPAAQRQELAIATLKCAGITGATTWYDLFESPEDMTDNFSRRAEGITSEGLCAENKNSISGWNIGGKDQGTIACYIRNGTTFLLWTDDDKKTVAAMNAGEAGQARAFQWFQDIYKPSS